MHTTTLYTNYVNIYREYASFNFSFKPAFKQQPVCSRTSQLIVTACAPQLLLVDFFMFVSHRLEHLIPFAKHIVYRVG